MIIKYARYLVIMVLFALATSSYATYLNIINNYISDGAPGDRTVAVLNQHCYGKHLGLNNVCVVYSLNGKQFHRLNNLPDEGPFTVYLYHGSGVSKAGPFATCYSSQGKTISVYENECR